MNETVRDLLRRYDQDAVFRARVGTDPAGLLADYDLDDDELAELSDALRPTPDGIRSLFRDGVRPGPSVAEPDDQGPAELPEVVGFQGTMIDRPDEPLRPA